MKTDDLRGQNQGHGVVEDTLSKQQSVQIHVHLQLIEDSQDRHCGARQTCEILLISLHFTTDQKHDTCH